MANKATSNDVARLAGVSRATVSRALSNIKVDRRTRERVLKAAAQLSYRPNALARGLSSSRSNLVVAIVNRIANTREAEVYDHLLRVLRTQGRTALIVSQSGGSSGLADAVSQTAGFSMDAAIAFADQIDAEMVRQTFGVAHPIMCNGQLSEFCTVADESEATRQCVNAMIALGKRNFAFISGRLTSQISLNRLETVERALAEYGLSILRNANGQFSYRGGYDAALSIVSHYPAIDAIVCANDAMAIGAMDALRHQLGRRVPEDVAICGYDNIEMAAWESYGLTTIEVSAPREAELIGDLVEHVIGSSSEPSPKRIEAKAQVVWRNSTPSPTGG